jgi:phosphonate transport system substrate-binding protein
MTASSPRSRRAVLTTLASLAATSAIAARAADAAPLHIALAPFLSPAALLAAFRPLREHLERALQRPVEMLTEKDFRALMEATRRQAYDVVQLPAHLARLAMLDWRYAQVAGTVQTFDVLVVVKDGGPVQTVADLRGRRAGMLDGLSMTATVGRRWLQDQGLAHSVEVLALPSVNSALFALDRGEVAMVVAGSTQLAELPASTPRTERPLARIASLPGPIYVAAPTLPAAEVAVIRAAMGSFRPDPERQPSAPNSTPLPLAAATLAALDPYVAIAREALAASR